LRSRGMRAACAPVDSGIPLLVAGNPVRPLGRRAPRRPPPKPPPGAGLRRQSRRSNGGYFDLSLRLPRLVLRGDGPSGREVFQQLLDDHAVTPLAVEPSVPPVDTDHPEARSLVQREARRVLGKDPGHELPEPASPAGVKEALEGRAPRAGAARAALDIHRVLAGAGVAGTGAVRADRGPGHDLAVALDDHRGVPVTLPGELRFDLLDRARLGLEGGDPILDALVVDPGDRR